MNVTDCSACRCASSHFLAPSGVATGVRGCGPHRAALARGGKGAKNAEIKKKIHVKIQIVSFICVRVQEKQSVTANLYLASAITLGPWLCPVRTGSPVSKT